MIDPNFHQKISVLIIENNRVDSKMLRGMLNKAPMGTFSVEVCDNLTESFQLLSRHNFDVALLDLNLKDSHGLDTLVKLNAAFPHLPIVVNTGAYLDDLGLKAVTSGAQDYLIKGKYLPYGLIKALYYAIERKKAEIELKNAHSRIDDTQSQLIQAEKINVVGGLASGVAHEVKNPLATILYGIEFLTTRVDREDEKIRLTLDSIKEAATKANRIIVDLLDFASLAALKKQPTDVNDIVTRSLSLVRHQCERAGISIRENLAGGLPLVEMDPNRIEQVLLDVLLNGIHAMDQGGLLTVTTLKKDFDLHDRALFRDAEHVFGEGDQVVCVEVTDTGAGIKEENLDKIFDPFFTTRRASGGVGLGLSIARTIMNNHQGMIEVCNCREGEGGAMARIMLKVGESLDDE